MSVKKFLEDLEDIAEGMWLDKSECRRGELYGDFYDKLFALREALGLPTAQCFDCGGDGSYDCQKCGIDLCKSCGEEFEGRFLCRSCVEEESAAKGIPVGMSAA